MTVFLDSSALVKLYADEDQSAAVRSAKVVVASEIAAVEVPAALWRKHRMGALTASDAQLLSAAFAYDSRNDGGEIMLLRPDSSLLRYAAALVARHPLRANHAVQLASALTASEALGRCRFGCFDADLNAAAIAEGLQLAW